MTLSGFSAYHPDNTSSQGIARSSSGANTSNKQVYTQNAGSSPCTSSTKNDCFSASDDWFTIADQRIALSSKMTGNENPAELTAFQAKDKSLLLKQEQAKMEYECGIKSWDAKHKSQKDSVQHRQKQIDSGVLFAP